MNIKEMVQKRYSVGQVERQGTPLILALGRQRQADLGEFEASLVYKS